MIDAFPVWNYSQASRRNNIERENLVNSNNIAVTQSKIFTVNLIFFF